MFKSVIGRFLDPGSVHKKVAGAHEGACEHVAVQPAPGQGEEGGGEPSGLRVCWDVGGGHFELMLKKYKTVALQE